jgi:hypothetical protein
MARETRCSDSATSRCARATAPKATTLPDLRAPCQRPAADLAERWGYLNRALRPRELGPFVERLAYRIASFPAEAIALAKRAVNAAELPTVDGLLEDTDCFNRSLPTAAARRRMARFLELGGQTREEELALGGGDGSESSHSGESRAHNRTGPGRGGGERGPSSRCPLAIAAR